MSKDRKRWAISIDIEGFSVKWRTDRAKVLVAISEQMDAIHRIGTKAYPDSPERLFAHQLADGFLIVSEFHELCLDRAASIAIALMRHLACNEFASKATIAEGDFADITGCYPQSVWAEHIGSGSVRMGCGLMTISSTVGEAQINAYALQSVASGPLLLIDPPLKGKLSKDFGVCEITSCTGSSAWCIDWLTHKGRLADEIRTKAGLCAPEDARRWLRKYLKRENTPSEKWKRGATQLLASSGC